MLRLRHVLFRSREPQPLAAVTRAIAEIPGMTLLVDRRGWTVTDQATGHVVETTLAEGPLVAADIRAIAATHREDGPEGRARIKATDARFELRYPDDDAAINTMLLVQDAVERATGGVGYDPRAKRIVVAARGESVVVDPGPAQKAEDARVQAYMDAMTDEDIDRELRARGLDPARTRHEVAQVMDTLDEQRRLSEAIEAALARPAQAAREPRATLLERLAALRDVPAVGDAIGGVLRRRALASMSDGEVQTVADEVAKWERAKG